MADPGYNLESDVDPGSNLESENSMEWESDERKGWNTGAYIELEVGVDGSGGVGVVDELEIAIDNVEKGEEDSNSDNNSNSDSNSVDDSNTGEWDGVSTYTDSSYSAYESTYGNWDDDEDDNNTKKTKKNIRIEEVIATYDTWVRNRDLKEEEIKTKVIPIFCDLDGVLVDFEAGVQKIFKNKKTAGLYVFLWATIFSSDF